MPVTDLSFLKTFTNGDAVKMKKYIGMFLQGAPHMITQMDDCYSSGNWESLKVTAHSLKPQVGYMGMKQLEQTIKDIEYMATHETERIQLREKMDYFKGECAKACEELNAVLQQLN